MFEIERKKRRTLLGSDARTRLLRKNILANFFLKGCTGVITLLLVPLTLNCLGEYANGVWLTISASLLLFENMDIGLGNGLRNKLAEYVAKEDWVQARIAVSSTVTLLGLIVIPVMLLLVFAAHNIDLHSLLNVSETIIPNLNDIVCVCIVLFCSTFIMKFIGNVYLGMQLPAVSNLLMTGGHPIILAGTYYMYVSDVHSVMAIAVLNLSVPLMMYLLAYPYTFYRKYPMLRPQLSLFSGTMARGLFSMGMLFFLNQVSSAIVFFSSNIMISRWFEPSAVTPYQIAFRYFNIPMLVFMVINAPNWSATTDALFRGDTSWIRVAVRRMDKILLLFLLALIVMVVVSQPIYAFWIGQGTRVSLSLTYCMALYSFTMMYSLAYCYFLNGVGALKLQFVCTLCGIVIYFVSSEVLHLFLGNVMCICLAMFLSLLPNAICNKIQFMKIINGTAHGIWKK